MSIYAANEDMINVGAYVKGSSQKIDYAIDKIDLLQNFLRQKYDSLTDRQDSFSNLSSILK